MQRPGLPISVICVLAAIALPELVLQLADRGILGTPRWRIAAYGYGAFWAGLLGNWQVNFANQPVTMFLSYSFLHADVPHLAGNMAGLIWLGPLAVARMGAGGFALLWGLSVLGGALAFWGLTASPAPMVGASGAVFGLAGGWVVWNWRDDIATGDQRFAVIGAARLLALLLAVNVVSWWAMAGQLAWETHLGGMVTGMAVAMLWPARGE